MGKYVQRLLPTLGIAVLVGILVIGAAWLKALSLDEETPAAPPVAGPPANSGTTRLDLGATSSADVLTCLTPEFAADAAQVKVLYGVKQARLGGSSPVLILRNAAGDVRLCDQFGSDSPAEAPLPTASSDRPVAFLSTGRSTWTCQGSTQVLDRFEKTTWLVVSPEVASVRQRYLVDGVATPWFESTAVGGYVHLQSWLEGPQPAETTYAEQFRVLDASGDDVHQTALPTTPTPLPGCSGGGSAQIG